MNPYSKNGTSSFALGTQATFYLLEKMPKQARRIYISPLQTRDDTYQRLREFTKQYKIPVIENNQKIFKELSGKDNTMVIGEFEKFQSDLDPSSNHVVLVNPMNMGNLGTIERCLVGFGIHDLAIITPSADPFDPKVVRASMGALFHLRIRLFSSFEEYQAAAGTHHFYPFMLQAKSFLPQAQITSPWSLIFGNESTGLDPRFLSYGEPLKIPQTPDVDSLNLDNAVAIALYQFTCR